MLSESDLGLRGLTALTEFYLQSGDMQMPQLVSRLGYKIEEKIFSSRFFAIAYLDRRIIELPPTHEVLKNFLGFHEAAHVCLARADSAYGRIAGKPDVPMNSISCEIEFWCDGFATLMMFANRGVRFRSMHSIKSFLTEGISTEIKEFNVNFNLFQGRRILRLAKRWFSRTGPSRAELIYLGTELVDKARELQKSTTK